MMSSFGDHQFTFCSIRAQLHNPMCSAHVTMKNLKFVKPILT